MTNLRMRSETGKELKLEFNDINVTSSIQSEGDQFHILKSIECKMDKNVITETRSIEILTLMRSMFPVKSIYVEGVGNVTQSEDWIYELLNIIIFDRSSAISSIMMELKMKKR